MIKLLLIVRYNFGYMVPNIPPFVGEFVCSKMKYKLKGTYSIRNSLIGKLKHFIQYNTNTNTNLYSTLGGVPSSY